ncbi:Bystin [Heracleum sosnowskyi]|uniref:Bystin n=1 Tax=Heracleum sosnowskyi TaxID=360622 RepID=A0AAD8M595_9APIA|nr:Bystin [Heracleum sosnowskyi]
MGKKRSRIQNPEPFLPEEGHDSKSQSSKKHSKAPKLHQQQNKLIAADMSSKILKEALIQQKEIQDEDDAQKPGAASFAFLKENAGAVQLEEEEELDHFTGFSETQSQYGGNEEEIDEDDEKLLEAFLSKDARPQRTLADLIVDKIKEKDAQVSSEKQLLPKMDDSIIELYKGVGKLLNKYTAGKIPKAFKHIPSLQFWEEKAERFYKLVLLPRIRDDISKNKKLHFALYQALKKSLYKPAAFNKGILFPLCESRTCNLREAVIIGSILQKVSIPPLHSSVALLKLAEMQYCGTTSYFIKLLVEKKYALPYRVLDALVEHFMAFLNDERIMPVIWHQSLLAFVQRYKNELVKEDKLNLNALVERQWHKLVTPEICRELKNSRNRGEKEDDLMSISSPAFVINKPIEEDRFDIPEVPMDED